MKPLPSLRHLEYLAALDEHGHFGRAAAACGASQSAFSAGIAELEQQLGVRIAERDRRHVLVTAAGRRLAARGRALLADARALVEMAGAEARPMSGEVGLGSIPTIAPFVMPRLMPALRKRFPELDLMLREDKTPALLEQLAQGRLDLLLIAFPYETPGCETMMLFRDAYLFACDRASPMAAVEAVRSRDIRSQSLMLLEPGHCLHSHALPVVEAAASAPEATFSATSLQTLVAMVAVGMGTTLLPQLAVDAGLLEGSQVVTRPLGYEGGKRTIGLAWRRNSARAAEFRKLGEAIQSWANSSGVGEPLAGLAQSIRKG
ncbi:hydrogen peroxide-inducible genes activator [Arenimonas caeni]|uniref:Hydrogen peroxide-inducible genes activator n=1 Tax=Arenimonas caeni TaxID=2058085 RepID=A0A2P6M8E2_9GAMM|nr:hydrogen peroxide-inducible genes activator [Arenimonas caeni]PRH82269.1 hydrogen peroxide-inducible genes activator [Arenimonas caeni]